MATSERRILLISALNRRGIKGEEARVLLHRYSQVRIARQVDYYDFEITSARGIRLPAWAATPWLSHRIRRNVPPPNGFQRILPGILNDIAKLRRRQGRRPGSNHLGGTSD